MEKSKLVMKPGALWPRVLQTTHHALQCGTLQTLPTRCELVGQDGIDFLVRIVTHLARKDQAKQALAKKTSSPQQSTNPFLPFEPDMFVADISNTHVCILNKFNVVAHHLLIVTRSFENQQSLLTFQDFEAMWACMAQFDGLAFYNAGIIAGASQPHKHLQLVPLPLASTGPKLPIEPLLEATKFHDTIGTNPDIPFSHAIARIGPSRTENPQLAAEATLELYYAMLHAVGLQIASQSDAETLTAPYNLLVTQQWMWLVPRALEHYHNISVNALGFAGALLASNERQLQTIKVQGPMAVLKSVAVS